MLQTHSSNCQVKSDTECKPGKVCGFAVAAEHLLSGDGGPTGQAYLQHSEEIGHTRSSTRKQC